MRSIKFLVLLTIILTHLFFSCGSKDCAYEYDFRQANASAVSIAFSHDVFHNKNFKFRQLEPYVAPQSNYTTTSFDYYFPKSANFPIPTDGDSYGFIIHYKDSFSDTLIFNYKVEIVLARNECHGEYYYQIIKPFNAVITNNYFKSVNVSQAFYAY